LRSAREAFLAIAIVAIATIASVLLRDALAPTNLAMIYLGGVVVVAMRCSRWISVTASFVSVAAFDFFCVPPYLTLAVSDYQ
jgi:two-component system sensor histidine kinase KdpD